MMKTKLLAILLLFAATLRGADLPTVTIEHLYYLQARAERVRKFKPEEMVDYCIAQKLGGGAFESLQSQLLTMRVDLAKLLNVEELKPDDARVVTLKRTLEAFSNVLREEAQKVQSGILREGQVASDALQAIARAQNPQ